MTTGSDGRFDDAKIGGPSVLWNEDAGEWWMYYYGRDKKFPKDVAPEFGTGSVGLAKSADGISWVRHEGHLAGGAIFTKSDDPNAFDSQFVGTGDVLRYRDSWIMAYFGGDSSIPETINGKDVWNSYRARGYRTRPGIARSDDGLHWERVTGRATGGAAVEIGTAIYGGFPALIHDGDRFLLYYSALEVGTAYWETRIVSSTDLVEWTDLGTLRWEDGPLIWERRGMVSRKIVPNFLTDDGKWLMIYAGLDGRYATMLRLMGAAVSDDGLNWRHISDEPIFYPSSLDRWDGAGVAYGNPVKVGKELRIYYYGFADATVTDRANRGIGLAISPDGTLANLQRYGE